MSEPVRLDPHLRRHDDPTLMDVQIDGHIKQRPIDYVSVSETIGGLPVKYPKLRSDESVVFVVGQPPVILKGKIVPHDYND